MPETQEFKFNVQGNPRIYHNMSKIYNTDNVTSLKPGTSQ